MSLEFKLNYYFEKYKDRSLISSMDFKRRFIKENGNFELLNELVIMINRYQVKKYGYNLNNYVREFKSREDIIKEKRNSTARIERRLGNRAERERRKSKYAN